MRQTGLEKQQAVQEKLAQLACYREGINAHLTAAIALAEESPGGLLMPNQSLLYTGRVLACSQLPAMMHIARELCGGQICVTPDAATFAGAETGAVDGEVLHDQRATGTAEDRRRLLAFARDLLNSDYAGHRLTFQLFAQSPPFAHLAAVYRNFDWSGPLRHVQRAAGSVRARARRRSRSIRCRRTRRIRPFNTRDTYPEQKLDNDLCQAVVAGNTVYLRGQVGQDLDTREIGRRSAIPPAQAERAMDNIELLLGECGATLDDICKCTIYLTDIRYREPVYRVLGERLQRRLPRLHRLVVVALARPEWVVEIDVDRGAAR